MVETLEGIVKTVSMSIIDNEEGRKTYRVKAIIMDRQGRAYYTFFPTEESKVESMLTELRGKTVRVDVEPHISIGTKTGHEFIDHYEARSNYTILF